MKTSVNWMTGNPPNKTKRYLVTYNTGNIDTCLWSNSAIYYYGESKDTYNTYSWLFPQGKVIAYAELPAPYTEKKTNF